MWPVISGLVCGAFAVVLIVATFGAGRTSTTTDISNVVIMKLVSKGSVRVYRFETNEAICYVVGTSRNGGLQCKWKTAQ